MGQTRARGRDVFEVLAPATDGSAQVLTPDALGFLGELSNRFNGHLIDLVRRRRKGVAPSGFLPETAQIRESEWSVVPPAPDYLDRRVEITGPVERKLVINALNSGAQGFMADFEDATSPTWANLIGGQANLIDTIEGTIGFEAEDGRRYELSDSPATLLVRPRGLHLPEKHIHIRRGPVAAALMDFGLFAFHCAPRLVERGRSAQFYLPKLEHHLEARLWNDVLAWTEQRLGLESGTFRATVLVETLPAAFQMDEILWELRTHAGGLNAGRWDYIFSAIKCFRDSAEHVLPDRSEVAMTAPFMRAYTELLVRTCHRRGTFAMGGMAALIPSRRDPAVNRRAVEAVRADKRREASDGFDGTWVAHPDLVSVAQEEFDGHLGARPHQIERRRDDVDVGADQLLDLAATPGTVTEAGMRNNVSVAFQYMSSWLCGRGAIAIHGLMEDAATAEICRTQLWHWIRHGAHLDDGQMVTAELIRQALDDETARIRATVGESAWQQGRPAETLRLFEQVTLGESLIEFITQPGYDLID